MENRKYRRGTKTSPFGTPGKINHDSTPFYSSNLYKDLPKEKKLNIKNQKYLKKF